MIVVRIFSQKYFSFSSFSFVQSLIKWSYFVDGPLRTLNKLLLERFISNEQYVALKEKIEEKEELDLDVSS